MWWIIDKLIIKEEVYLDPKGIVPLKMDMETYSNYQATLVLSFAAFCDAWSKWLW